ncbi:MAG TPA: ABC transporter permease subunit, partial [Candidatus Limnocylindria bacterium]
DSLPRATTRAHIAMTSRAHNRHAGQIPLWRDARVLRIAAQVAIVAVVGLLLVFMASNMLTAMDSRGLGFGFNFLNRQAGFEIGQTLISYSAAETYGRAFLVGLLNTLVISVAGIILATILGTLLGIARLSPNWLLSRIAGAYVELFRNTPLLVQLVILYFAVFLQLPRVNQSFAIGDVAFLNQRGLYLPSPQPGASLPTWLGLVIVGITVAVVARWVARRLEDQGRPSHRLRTVGVVTMLALPIVGWFAVGGAPLAFEVPVLGRFNFSGGLELSSSFAALLTGLVLYTAAFIGEVVRGGIQAVRHGQREAARALGMSEGQVLHLVIFPQAMRVIVPPLTSQYLNLAKNSSLGIAVLYPDLFSVGRTMANQTGQPVSVIILMMGTYLAISIVMSLVMNLYNRRVQVTER